MESGSLIQRRPITKEYADGVVLSSDGRLIAGTIGQTLYIWDTVSGNVVRTFNDAQHVRSVRFSADGTVTVFHLGSGAPGRMVWNLGAWDMKTSDLRVFSASRFGFVLGLAWDGSVVALTEDVKGEDGRSTRFVNLLDTRTGEVRQRFLGEGLVHGGVFSQDSQMFAGIVSFGLESPWSRVTSDVVIWDLESGQVRQRLTEQQTIYMVTLTPGAETVLTGSEDKVRLWDLRSGKPKALIHVR
jgi:WD40 repeat protein